jgi:hypothetical protein
VAPALGSVADPLPIATKFTRTRTVRQSEDIAELRERHRAAAGLEKPVRDRASTSFDSLTERVRQVAAARRAKDRTACRVELQALAREALLLSRQEPLW